MGYPAAVVPTRVTQDRVPSLLVTIVPEQKVYFEVEHGYELYGLE